MKVLSMAWTIYDSRIKEFSKNYTGGGLVIKNICEYIGRKAESYLFIGKCWLSEQTVDNITIVGTDFKVNEEDTDQVRDEQYIKNMAQKFELAVKKINPDIVNFHGIGELMQFCIEVCIKKNIPYVYTDHLFISRDKKFGQYNKNIEWKEKLYHIPDLKVIAVSTGMKNKILQNFPFISSNNITVIQNGTDFIPDLKVSNLCEKYALSNKKVLLCVGTIVERKNQIQAVRAFQLLPEAMQNNIKIVFCGLDSMNGALQESIHYAKLQDSLIYIGAVNNEEIKKYYSIAQGLIMPSYAEGLSIAALETIAYGLPVIMFSDSECAMDLNDEEVVCLAKERSDQELANAMIRWYQKDWDKNYITEYSKYYSMERMAEDYIRYYTERISK